MDGFQLTVIAMTFSDSQWHDEWPDGKLAAARRAEFLGEAEYAGRVREAQDAAGPRKPWRSVVQSGLLALRARVGAMRQRRNLAEPAGLAPVATETT